MSAGGIDRSGEPLKEKKIGSKKPNTFSRTATLEKAVAALEKTVRDQATIISELLTKSGSSLSIEDTEEEKRLRAIKEKGGIVYGN